MEFLLALGLFLILAFFFWIIYDSHNFNGKEFKLKNSRQFIMRLQTAALHDIQKEDNEYVSMVYGKKRYLYKYIRTIKKSYHYMGRREYIYFVLEKKTDNQPPNYHSMEQMKIKEEEHNKKHSL